MPIHRESEEDIAGYILDYFLRNPKASDTLEGIVRWRLLDQAVRYAVEDTRQALDALVEKGFLKKTTVPSSGEHFSLNEPRREEAENSIGRSKQKRRRRGPQT